MTRSLKYRVAADQRVMAAFQSELTACDFAREFSRRNGLVEVFLNTKNGGLVAQYDGGETTPEFSFHEEARNGWGAHPRPVAAIAPN